MSKFLSFHLHCKNIGVCTSVWCLTRKFLLHFSGHFCHTARRSPALSRRRGMNGWLLQGPFWRLPWGSSIHPDSWNIRSRLTGALTLQAGPTAPTLPQFQFRTSGAHSWVLKKKKQKQKPNSFRNTASPLTLHSFPQLAPSPAKKAWNEILCFFFFLLDTIMFARQKPLETVIKSGPSYFSIKKPLQLKSLVQHFHYPLSPSLPSRLLPHRRCPPQPRCSPPPHTSSFSPLLLRRCCCNVSITADRQSGGSAGCFRSQRGSSARSAPRLQAQAPTEALSQAGQRDTWPNHGNTSSCRLPDARRRQNPGQRWRKSGRNTADISLNSVVILITSATRALSPWCCWAALCRKKFAQYHNKSHPPPLPPTPDGNKSESKCCWTMNS